MTVTKLEALTKTKYRIFLDDKPAFVLHRGELSKYGIKEGGELSNEGLALIMKEIVKSAKLKAMRLLEITDRTEAELTGRLKKAGYPSEAVKAALSYVKSYGYVDDNRYAINFIERRKDSKSRKEMYALLLEKGLAKEIISQAMQECGGQEDETAAIENLILKKGIELSSASDKELAKLYAYLARKGFSYENIRRAVQQLLPERLT